MIEKTVSKSQGFGLRRVFWAAPLAYLAMGLTLACSGHVPDDDSIYEDENVEEIEDNNAAQNETATVEEKALLRRDVVAARPCENCTPKVVCEQTLVPCDPPVEVNGRQILCLKEDCREEMVCTPCSAEGDIDRFDGLDLSILRGIGRVSPIDSPPFSF